MIRTLLASTLALAAFTSTALADDAADPAAPPAPPTVASSTTVERTLSINADPFGLVQGYYGGNVEWLHGAHGLLVEASYFHKGDEKASLGGANATLGYRWHWRGRQNSGFLGVNLSSGIGTGTLTVDNAGQMMTYDASVKTLSVTADIGKRWQLDNGINITARIGGGYASRDVSTESTDPNAQQAAQDAEDILAFLPIALDGELSLGYSF